MSDEAERQAVEADCCWITVGSRRHNSDSIRMHTNTTTTTSLTDCSKPHEKASPITASGSYFQVLADEEDEDDDEEEEEHPPTCPICIELVNVIRGRLECVSYTLYIFIYQPEILFM